MCPQLGKVERPNLGFLYIIQHHRHPGHPDTTTWVTPLRQKSAFPSSAGLSRSAGDQLQNNVLTDPPQSIHKWHQNNLWVEFCICPVWLCCPHPSLAGRETCTRSAFMLRKLHWEFLHNLKALLLFGWHQCWLWTPWRLWVVSDCPLNEKRQLQEPIQDWHLTGCTIEGLICEACLVNTFKNVVKCLGNENSWLALLVQNYFITKAILKLSLVLDWLLEIVYILEFILAGASFELLWQCRDGKSGKINYLCCTAVKLHEY